MKNKPEAKIITESEHKESSTQETGCAQKAADNPQNGITRREFGKGLLTTAVAVAAGFPSWNQLANAKSSPKHAGKHEDREFLTLHFDLGHAHKEDRHHKKPSHHNHDQYRNDDKHYLHVLGKRILLKAHTQRSLDRAIKIQPELARIPRHRITHYAPNVPLNSSGVHRIYVSTRSKTRGFGILLVGMHIPRAARAAAGLLEPRAEPVIVHRGVEIVLEDAGGIYFGSDFPNAKATVQHHPEIATIDPDVAAAIEPYFDAATVYDLAASISTQGPAYELASYDGQSCIADDQALGWAALLPVTDLTGDDNHDMVYSCTTEQGLEAAVREVQSQILDDPTLKGILYDFQYHDDQPDASQLGLGDGNAGLTTTITGYHHNIGWSNFSVDSSDGTKFSFLMWNANLLWYGVYITWLDLAGNPMSDSSRAGEDTLAGLLRAGNEVLLNGIDMETDERKWVRLLPAPATFFGIPFGAIIPTDIELQFPPGASGARVEIMGLGSHGDVKHAWSLFPGAAISAVANFMVPMWFLSKGVGETESGSLNALIANNPSGVQLPMAATALALLVAEGNADPEADLLLAGSFASVFSGMANAWVAEGAEAINSELLIDWLQGELSAAEIQDSCPFLGWGLRALQVGGTLAAMAESTAEILTNPLVITNTITQTHTLRITVKPDPQDSGFPATWSEGQIVVSTGDKKVIKEFGKADVEIVTGSDGRPVFTYDATGMPSSGSDAVAEVVLLSSSGWATGSGSIDFLNSRDKSIDLEITIKENPVPITKDTVYTHNRVLAFDESQYLWKQTSAIPWPAPDLVPNGIGISLPGNTALWVPGGVMGYSWQGNSSGITDCETGQPAMTSVYRFQTVSVVRDTGTPNDTLKRITCGYTKPMPVAFDRRLINDSAAAASGNHFYLTPLSNVIDPTDPSVLPAEFHARKLVLDSSTPVNPKDDLSWGRFRIPSIDRLEYYESGSAAYLFGLSAVHNKIGRLRLSDQPVATADVSNNATLLIGKGLNDSRLINATAMAISKDGALMVLQNTPKEPSIKAFDIDGKPWRLFDLGAGPTSVMPLTTERNKNIVYLDIAMADSKLIWVLSYEVSGATSIPTDPKSFRLDIYDYMGNQVMRQTNVPVARISVDTFHNLYTMNYQYVLSPDGLPISRTEPSVSDWLPSTP